MPMSEDFKERLFPKLPKIASHFGTPFHIYDATGIVSNGRKLNAYFRPFPSFREFFAVKALPNPAILEIMKKLGFGFDCSSSSELKLARSAGASPDDIIFTSNNTSQEEYLEAQKDGGCILNLDDISFVAKVPEPFPGLICFRYNPGKERTGNAIIGKPEEAKYGLRKDQLVSAFSQAIKRGARRFGLHTMIVSNQLDYRYMVQTVKMLLDIAVVLRGSLQITFGFINIGGGFGIPYLPTDTAFNMEAFSREAYPLLCGFGEKQGYIPRLFMESGRMITGPYGVLVTRVINRMSKHREYVGVDACMSSLMRPAMYGAYHHVTVLNPGGSLKLGNPVQVDVVGSLCENNDKFAISRFLNDPKEGDLVVIHDAGAHGHAMGFNYNGRLRPQELFLMENGDVKPIRRAETYEDYIRTAVERNKDVLAFS